MNRIIPSIGGVEPLNCATIVMCGWTYPSSLPLMTTLTATRGRIVLISWPVIKQAVRCGFHTSYIDSWTMTSRDGRVGFETQMDLI